VRWLSPTLALLNVRLGYWLRNPRDLGNEVSLFRPKEWLNAIWGKFYLILEMLNQLDEEKTFVYLSDGGHIENLGIYQLLKRGCRLIIAVDAEADPEISCSSLLKLERYARIDLGVRIILPWEYIRERYRETSDAIDPHTPKEAKRYRGPHCAIGRILYEDGNYGVLLYFKSSLSGDEKDYILDYKKRYPDFPHENTSDQFFTEEQFEVYRALGYHVVEGYFRIRTTWPSSTTVIGRGRTSTPPRPKSPAPWDGNDRRRSIILQQPLDVIELFLRAGHVAEALAQFLDDAARALHIDLARHLDGGIVAIIVAAQRPAERIGLLLGARLAEAAAVALPRRFAELVLHRLRQALRALA
jgi:hypothetical protein